MRTLTISLLLLTLSTLAFAATAVEGTVTDAAGKPVAGARVTLQYAEGPEAATAVTAADGGFQFGAVEAGSYVISVEAHGFYHFDYRLVVRAREPLSLALQLTPAANIQQAMEVHSEVQTIDPEKTGSGQMFTRQQLERLPEPMTESTNTLVANLMPGASASHDNFLSVRGTEFSLHEFVNGVSFLDNMQPQFSPGVSPQIFETVDLLTGGFPAEFGNRFGGVLDITTRSGRTMAGHGSANFRGATLDNYDLNADYGGAKGNLGYYVFVDGFTSGRYLDPPEPVQYHDFGAGARAAAQLDWSRGKDAFNLLLMGSGTNFQQPNLLEDQLAGRNASRRLRQQTAMLTWLHTFSDTRLLSTSIYERDGNDYILPTTDPDTPLSYGSRNTFTLGVKSDFTQVVGRHVFKAGVDLVKVRELESFYFDPRGDPDFPINFSGGLNGGQASLYAQDHIRLVRNLTVDLGLRYDHFDLVTTQVQTSPRAGLAYHIARTKSVIHAAYNRLFSPPPIEYSILASWIGTAGPDLTQRVGNVRAYTQNYFEAGWQQEVARDIAFEVNAYLHTGHNSFENHEISITRLFLPINFHTARAEGAEFVMNFRQLQRLGITGRFQYAASKTYFYGPVTGGFTGDEPLAPGERILPAFDQTHTATANLIYTSKWRGLWAATAMRYGSGTVIENGPRLPQHFTTDLATGMTIWNHEPQRLDMEIDVTNVSDSRYQIAKESEEIPIQYAPARTVGGSLKLRF